MQPESSLSRTATLPPKLNMSISERLLTIEDYLAQPDDGRRTELVRGQIVEMNLPRPKHGKICQNIAARMFLHADEHHLGHVVSNDAAIITSRDPDTMRGADVAFYSFRRVPAGPMPDGYLDVVPEVAIEVRSPDDRWPALLAKVAEYLNAGVEVVVVLDPDSRTARTYRPNGDIEMLGDKQTLRLPEFSPLFTVAVAVLFA